MPSLSMERQLVEEGGETAMAQALVMVEKKVRNLEKRKTRLDTLKQEAEKGKSLESEQLQAIERYDHVVQMLDFVREMSANLRTLSADEERAKKKAAKKEAAERARQELGRLATSLQHQHYLRLVHAEPERILSELGAEARGLLADFAGMVVEPKEEENRFQATAEHLVALQDAKTKSVLSTNYKELRSMLDAVMESQRRQLSEKKEEETTTQEVCGESVESSAPVSESGQVEASNNNMVASNNNMVAPNEPPSAVPSMTFVSNQQHHLEQPMPHPPQMGPGAPITFMQESQIDLESPHMDPAVVAVLPHLSEPVANNGQGYNNGMPPPFRAHDNHEAQQRAEPRGPSRTEPESAPSNVENAPQDTMTNITDWEGGDPNKEGERGRGHDGGHRGWRGGRGRGRGRGGHYRGHYEDRGDRRGGRGGYHRGGQRHYEDDGRREFRRGGRGRSYGGHHNNEGY